MDPKEITIEDLSEMSMAKQIHLAQDILNRVATLVEPPDHTLTEEQKADLRLRQKEFRDDPSSAQSWESVKANIRTKIANAI